MQHDNYTCNLTIHVGFIKALGFAGLKWETEPYGPVSPTSYYPVFFNLRYLLLYEEIFWSRGSSSDLAFGLCNLQT